ncbi:MAG: MarR family transcriptional regulator, partial [Deltaproteobacteria bacterium]
VVEIELTNIGNEIVSNYPSVAQGLLLKGLEELSNDKLAVIAEGLEQLANILGAQDSMPQLLLSPEIKLPRRKMKKR